MQIIGLREQIPHRPVLVSFLKISFKLKSGYVPTASAYVHTRSVASAFGLGFMIAANLKGMFTVITKTPTQSAKLSPWK